MYFSQNFKPKILREPSKPKIKEKKINLGVVFLLVGYVFSLVIFVCLFADLGVRKFSPLFCVENVAFCRKKGLSVGVFFLE